MKKRERSGIAAAILGAIVLALLVGCAARPVVVLLPGAEAVRVARSDPGDNFAEVGPVSGLHGNGCGAFGHRGTYEGAVTSLKNNSFAMGGTYVQVFTISEPRLQGDCFVNTYRISGTAYRQTRAAPSPLPIVQQPSSADVVQKLRDLQKLREQGVITDQEFETLKARIISGP